MNNEFKVGGFALIIGDTGVGQLAKILTLDLAGAMVSCKNVSGYYKVFQNLAPLTDEEAMLYLLEQ